MDSWPPGRLASPCPVGGALENHRGSWDASADLTPEG